MKDHAKHIAYYMIGGLLVYAAIRLFEHYEMKRRAKAIAGAIAENTAVNTEDEPATTGSRED